MGPTCWRGRADAPSCSARSRQVVGSAGGRQGRAAFDRPQHIGGGAWRPGPRPPRLSVHASVGRGFGARLRQADDEGIVEVHRLSAGPWHRAAPVRALSAGPSYAPMGEVLLCRSRKAIDATHPRAMKTSRSWVKAKVGSGGSASNPTNNKATVAAKAAAMPWGLRTKAVQVRGSAARCMHACRPPHAGALSQSWVKWPISSFRGARPWRAELLRAAEIGVTRRRVGPACRPGVSARVPTAARGTCRLSPKGAAKPGSDAFRDFELCARVH